MVEVAFSKRFFLNDAMPEEQFNETTSSDERPVVFRAVGRGFTLKKLSKLNLPEDYYRYCSEVQGKVGN